MYCVSFSLFITENANVELKKKKNDKKLKILILLKQVAPPEKFRHLVLFYFLRRGETVAFIWEKFSLQFIVP